MGQYLNELYAQNFALQCENKALRRKVDEFKSGRRYKILQDSYDRIVAGYKQENRRLTRELAAARATTTRVWDIWFEQCDTDFDWYRTELEKKDQHIQELEEKYWRTLWEYDKKLLEVEERYIVQLKEKDDDAAKKDAVIQELTARLAHAEALLNRDGSNTGTPTSQTPSGKKKRIPNTRKPSENPKGGQEGHEQHILAAPNEEKSTIKYSMRWTIRQNVRSADRTT